MDTHVTAVAVIRIGFGALGLLGAFVVFLAVAGGGLLSGDLGVITLTGTLGIVIGGFLALTALPGLIGGIGLLARKEWARILVLIVSVFDILNVPVGTAVAVYTFWVLLQDETRRLFRPTYG